MGGRGRGGNLSHNNEEEIECGKSSKFSGKGFGEDHRRQMVQGLAS